MNWLAIVLGFVVALDHALAAIPAIGANSTFQLISSWIIALAGKQSKKPLSKKK